MSETPDSGTVPVRPLRRTNRPEAATGKVQNLMAALVAARAAMKESPKKSATATVQSAKGSFSYSYATLDEVIDAVVPHLLEHGLYLMQTPHLQDGMMVLTSTLWHSPSNELVDLGDYPLGPSGMPAQQLGSAITYARRYTIGCIAFIAPEEDEDGAAASRQPPPRPTPQARPVAKSQPPQQHSTTAPVRRPVTPTPQLPVAPAASPVADFDGVTGEVAREPGELTDEEVGPGDERWEKERKRFFGMLRMTLAGAGVAWRGQRYSSMTDPERRAYICDVLKRDIMSLNDLTLADLKLINTHIDVGIDPMHDKGGQQ